MKTFAVTQILDELTLSAQRGLVFRYSVAKLRHLLLVFCQWTGCCKIDGVSKKEHSLDLKGQMP